MDEKRRAELKAKGWVETTVEELFGLDEVDMQVVELRVRLAREVRRRREAAGLTQEKLAELIGSSQSRIAKVEGTADGVGLELKLTVRFPVPIGEKKILARAMNPH